MGLMAKDSGGGDFELAPAGNHVGICYMVCDLGDQEVDWQGAKKIMRKVRVSWELPDELMADGRPFSISKKYTLSLSEKANLRKDLESWRGRPFTKQELDGFELFNVVEKPCMVNVIHDDSTGKVYANVASVAALPKSFTAPKLVNKPIRFSLEDADAIQVFNGLPDWLQKMVNARGLQAPQREAHHHNEPPPNFDDFDDDIPFNEPLVMPG